VPFRHLPAFINISFRDIPLASFGDFIAAFSTALERNIFSVFMHLWRIGFEHKSSVVELARRHFGDHHGLEADYGFSGGGGGEGQVLLRVLLAHII
jgi:hypothetical protein